MLLILIFIIHEDTYPILDSNEVLNKLKKAVRNPPQLYLQKASVHSTTNKTSFSEVSSIYAPLDKVL